MADANKSLLTGYSYLLRGYASAWKIQKWMLTIIHWTEHKVPNEGMGVLVSLRNEYRG